MILSPPITLSPNLPLIRLEWFTLGLLAFTATTKRSAVSRLFTYSLFTLLLSVAIGQMATFIRVGEFGSQRLYLLMIWPALLLVSHKAPLDATSSNLDACRATVWLATGLSAFVGWMQSFDLLGINSWLSPLYLGYDSRQAALDAFTQGRVYGTFGNSNAFPTALSLLVTLALCLDTSCKVKPNAFKIIATLAILQTSLLTGSRTGIGFSIVVAVAAIYSWYGKTLRDGASHKLLGALLALSLLMATVARTTSKLLASDDVAGHRLRADAIVGNNTTLARRFDKWADISNQLDWLDILLGSPRKSIVGLDNELLLFIDLGGIVGIVGVLAIWCAFASLALLQPNPSARRWALLAVAISFIFSNVAFFVTAYQLPIILTFILSLHRQMNHTKCCGRY